MHIIKAQCILTRKPTSRLNNLFYTKLFDFIDFYVMKEISSNYAEVEGLIELMSYHIPVLLSLNYNVIGK